MKKTFLKVLAFTLVFSLITSSIFASGAPEQSKEKTVNMFQLKVEIKDALYCAA